MFRKIKERFYFLKQWHRSLFTYPVDSLKGKEDVDYDRYWEEKRGDYIGVLSPWQKDRADIVLRNIDRETGLHVVDIGCGNGLVLKHLKKHSLEMYTTGIDDSNRALEVARKNGVDVVIKSDIREKEIYAQYSFVDYILFLEVLEHVPDPELLLKYGYGCARRGVFFSFPNSGYFLHRFRLLFGKFPLQWRTHPGEHIRFWTLTDLKWWLRALGYEKHHIVCYRGIPFLNRLWPSLFAAGFLVKLTKGEQ